MTFCVGGPRYFENNVCLENSFRHAPGDRNQARDIHHQCVFRDCKFVYRSPLFRQHDEFPTNPSLKESNNEPWWDIENRELDLFEDADEYGYLATQLTHLPKFASYDAGNMLYSPYDGSCNASLRKELTASKTLLDFLH